MNQEKEEIAIQEDVFVNEVLADYKLACESREASLLGRKEVLTGKAKFGIFGDGKEVAQIAMAKQFKNGDFRSGYYRDQTFMMAIGALSIQQAFAALYAHTDVEKEPASAGRQMGGHYSTRSINSDGTWRDLTKQKNSSSDISPTASQMPRLLGLAQASKVFRQNADLHEDFKTFSDKGNEVAFGTIGDASTSEGLFFETINAAGVLQVPMVMSIWDDGYGISVPKKYQTTGESISQLLKGIQRDGERKGFDIYNVKGWDYPGLVSTYEKAVKTAREEHVPILIHVEEVTQPQGHSTSGSHERYKSEERLAWGREYDCIKKMREWILEHDVATQEQLDEIEKTAKKDVRTAQKAAWSDFQGKIDAERNEVVGLIEKMAAENPNLSDLIQGLKKEMNPVRKDVFTAVRRTLHLTIGSNSDARKDLIAWLKEEQDINTDRYSSHLYSQSEYSALKVEEVKPDFGDTPKEVDGRLVLRNNFDALFRKYPEVLTFGEDVGKIGGVNQSMEEMQERFGELRVSDTGIREATILGQGIGMAMRGLRPIAEIQYLDYLLYALQIMSDDLATVQYRTHGRQKAPLIVRTRGHRLEGIWHSGSPMGMIINAVRGIHVLVPRNMTKAAGFYNILLQTDEPALVIECLNGYRLKEKMPVNLGTFTTPIGEVETIREGNDLTVLSYGSTLRIVEQAAAELAEIGIEVEIIDAQSLLPFDINNDTVKSLQKTNRLLVIDEDVPGGASAYLLQQVIEKQGGYRYLDSDPQTLSAKEHRPAYGTDGDYFSKPSVEDVFEKIYDIMHEANPNKFPGLYQ